MNAQLIGDWLKICTPDRLGWKSPNFSQFNTKNKVLGERHRNLKESKGLFHFLLSIWKHFFFPHLMSWGFWNSFENSRFSREVRELGLENSLPTWLLHAMAGTSSCSLPLFPSVGHAIWQSQDSYTSYMGASSHRQEADTAKPRRATPSTDTGSLCHSHWSERPWVKPEPRGWRNRPRPLKGEVGRSHWGRAREMGDAIVLSLKDIICRKGPKRSILGSVRTKDLITSITKNGNKFSSLLIIKKNFMRYESINAPKTLWDQHCLQRKREEACLKSYGQKVAQGLGFQACSAKPDGSWGGKHEYGLLETFHLSLQGVWEELWVPTSYPYRLNHCATDMQNESFVALPTLLCHKMSEHCPSECRSQVPGEN